MILAIGIFLRTYKFQEWLRFNQDQARDVVLVEKVLNRSAELPLLGPVAAKTPFKLGPAYYYMQYASARVFGAEPEKVAFPDLFFSVGSIVLLYLLLRKYFDRKVSLSVIFLFAISYFTIRYSRFSWNPNPQAFFVILLIFSFFELISAKNIKEKIFWSITGGLALGIGVQLQTLSLFILPIFSVAGLFLLMKKKLISWKVIALVLTTAFLFNLPQVISEARTGGQNVRDFFFTVSSKSEKNKSFLKTIKLGIQCQLQSNVYTISSLGTENTCDIFRGDDNISKKDSVVKKYLILSVYFVGTLFVLGFSIGGYWLLVGTIRREIDVKKKTYLQLIGIFALISFVMFIPVSHETTMRFFVVVEVLPYFLLALWLVFLREKFRKKWLYAVGAIVVILAFSNALTIGKYVGILNGTTMEDDRNIQFMSLGEAKFISQFLLSNSQAGGDVYLDGKNMDVDEYKKSIEYFTREKNLVVKKYNGSDNIGNQPIFLLSSVFSGMNRKLTVNEKTNYIASETETYGRLIIMKLEILK